MMDIDCIIMTTLSMVSHLVNSADGDQDTRCHEASIHLQGSYKGPRLVNASGHSNVDVQIIILTYYFNNSGVDWCIFMLSNHFINCLATSANTSDVRSYNIVNGIT